MDATHQDELETRLQEIIELLDDLMRLSDNNSLFIERKSRGRHLFWNEWELYQPRRNNRDGRLSSVLALEEVYSPEFLDIIKRSVGGALSPRMDCTLCFSDKRLMRGNIRMSNTVEDIRSWLKEIEKSRSRVVKS